MKLPFFSEQPLPSNWLYKLLPPIVVRCVVVAAVAQGGSMRKSHIAKLDSKGRILLPVHVREAINAGDGTEFVIFPEEGSIKILPLLKGRTAELRFLIADTPGSLAAIAKTLADFGVNIIMSQSHSLPKNKLAEWDIIADITQMSGSFDRMKTAIEESVHVKKVDVLNK